MKGELGAGRGLVGLHGRSRRYDDEGILVQRYGGEMLLGHLLGGVCRDASKWIQQKVSWKSLFKK